MELLNLYTVSLLYKRINKTAVVDEGLVGEGEQESYDVFFILL